MEEKVSVIIPFYNPDTSFNMCLQSVCSQTYRNLEILLIDDGSESSYLKNIKPFLNSDTRIKLLRMKHQGAGEARNKGLVAATGKYVCFLDSDDFFENNFLEEMMKKAEKEESDIVATEFYLYDHKSKKDISYYSYSVQVGNCIESPINEENIFQKFTPNVWDKLFRLSYLRKNDIKFQNLYTCNDLTFTYLAIAGSSKISILRDPLIHYRINQKSSISSRRGKHAKNVCLALKLLQNELTERKLISRFEKSFTLLAWRAIRHELASCSLYQTCKLLISMITILPVGLLVAVIIEAVRDTFGLIFKSNQDWIEKINL